MSNEQKLRALLAEAHSFVDPAEGDLFDRIHAALAEPVDDYDVDADLRLHKEDRLRLRAENLRLERERDEARAALAAELPAAWREDIESLNECLERVGRERDEARAEVERLRKAVHTRACRNQSAYNLECVCGADEHQRDLQKLAYQRGAEAMREAAALCAEREETQLPLHVAAAIRALPVPEDK